MTFRLCARLFAVLISVSIFTATGARAAPLLDVIFVLDGSGSISAADYQTQIDATKGYISTLQNGVPGIDRDPGPPVAPDLLGADLNVGLVQFSTNAVLDLGLTGNLAAANSALDAMSQQFGQTNHAAAFALAASELSANGRAGAQQAIVLVTDGEANQPGGNPLIAAISAADGAKSDGILIFTIGVGNDVDLFHLAAYSSGPDFVAGINDYDALDTVTSQIAETLLIEETAVSVDGPAPLALLGLGIAVMTCLRRRSIGS